MSGTMVRIRYIVHDVDAAIAFYTEQLGFQIDTHPRPGFAMVSRGNLQLLLNRPGAGGAGQAMPDGQLPTPERRRPLSQRDRDWQWRPANSG